MSYFVYSYDGNETIEGYFGTEDDAFDAAVAVSSEIGKNPFTISLYHNAELTWNTNAEDIVTEIEENVCDQIADVGAEVIATEEDIKDLDRRLDACIKGWIKDRHIRSSFDLISWTKQFVWDSKMMEYVQNYDYEDR